MSIGMRRWTNRAAVPAIGRVVQEQKSKSGHILLMELREGVDVLGHQQDTRLRDKMLEEIQAVGFALLELNLYLDTHPNDQHALGEYNSLSQHYQMLRFEYEKKFGPLQPFGQAMSAYPWQWIDTPWPWQM